MPNGQPPTALDLDTFLTVLAEAGGNPAGYAERPPRSLEQLFERLHDPAGFGLETVATLRAAAAAVSRASTRLSVDPRLREVTVYPGDLHVAASFTFSSHVLVLGDLEVDRVVTAAPAHAILMVAGSARCHAMQLVRGYLFVTGDVAVAECFLGTAYGLAKVGGRIVTPLYLHDDSWGNLALDADLDDASNESNVDARLKLDVGAAGARESLAEVLRRGTREPGAVDAGAPVLGEAHAYLDGLFEELAAGARIVR